MCQWQVKQEGKKKGVRCSQYFGPLNAPWVLNSRLKGLPFVMVVGTLKPRITLAEAVVAAKMVAATTKRKSRKCIVESD